MGVGISRLNVCMCVCMKVHKVQTHAIYTFSPASFNHFRNFGKLFNINVIHEFNLSVMLSSTTLASDITAHVQRGVDLHLHLHLHI